MKICIVTCYKDPDYIRARTLRAALQADPANNVIVIRNTRKDILRYPEVMLKLAGARLRHHPDVYLLTFRGYELLPFFNAITIGKKRIFDEFINLVEWVVYEHKKIRSGSFFERLLTACYRMMVNRCDIVLADTESHARYSAALLNLPIAKFRAVPVGTDEVTFKPRAGRGTSKTFQVMYYGNMLPLHGLQYVLDSALALRTNPDIRFLLIGGKQPVEKMVMAAREKGARITYRTWVPYGELPDAMAKSAINLGGPFGGTLQAGMVITGKSYQSLAMGVPTLIGETKEKTVLIDGKNCLMVPQADGGALAQKILWAWQHPKELHEIGLRGRKAYEQYYSTLVIASRMREIIRSL